MAVLKVDLQACQGYANCVVNAEDYFDLDDDGIVVLRKVNVTDGETERVRAAVRSCPVTALQMEDE